MKKEKLLYIILAFLSFGCSSFSFWLPFDRIGYLILGIGFFLISFVAFKINILKNH